MSDTVQTPAEMALYLVAVRHPNVFAEAEREARDFSCAMLANNQAALRRVKALLGAPARSREEMIEAGAQSGRDYWAGPAPHLPEWDSLLESARTSYRELAEAVLIAAGVIPAEPSA